MHVHDILCLFFKWNTCIFKQTRKNPFYDSLCYVISKIILSKKLVVESTKMSKQDRKSNEAKTRKRTKMNSQDVTEMSVEQMVENSKLSKKPVKRKIDFDKVQRNKILIRQDNVQKNNNATNIEGNVRQTRNRSRSEDNKVMTTVEPVSSKVCWTQEFLDKVKKSNAKHRKQQTVVKSGVNNSGNSLQELVPEQRGDGIQTVVDKPVEDEEDILDYNDDLSIEDEEMNPDEELLEMDQVNVTGLFCKQHIVLSHVFFRYKSPGG